MNDADQERAKLAFLVSNAVFCGYVFARCWFSYDAMFESYAQFTSQLGVGAGLGLAAGVAAFFALRQLQK